jgi:hypothetical protein
MRRDEGELATCQGSGGKVKKPTFHYGILHEGQNFVDHAPNEKSFQ